MLNMLMPQGGDNNWVSIEKLPGKDGEFYVTSDTPLRYVFDLNSLQAKEKIEYTDELKCDSGISHSQYTKSGDQVTICATAGKDMFLNVFRINADNTRKRIKIATIPTEHFSYQHSFALTDNYAIIFESPYHLDLKNIVLGHPMDQSLRGNLGDTTKVHVISINDGKVQTIDYKMWSLVLHYGNAFEKDGKVMVDVASFEEPTVNPFTNFNYD